MQISYEILCRLEVRHDYYRDQQGRDIVFVPVGECAQVLNQTDFLLLKPFEGGVHILYDVARKPEIREVIKNRQLAKLSFLIYIKNPLFFNFTETPRDNNIWYFTNLYTAAVVQKTISRQGEAYLSESDLSPVKQEGMKKSKLTEITAPFSIHKAAATEHPDEVDLAAEKAKKQF